MKYACLCRASQLLFFASVLIAAAAPASTPSQVPSPDSKIVSLRVRVTDNWGRAISGLQRDQFSVLEKDVKLEIANFDSRDEPASVVLLFDVSGSIRGSFSKAAVQSAYQFMQSSNKSNEYLIIAFSERARVVCDWGCDEQGLKTALSDVGRQEPKKNTALYDACSLALDNLESSKHPKRVILLFSDGLDNASKLSFQKMRKALAESSTSLYTIGLMDESYAGSALGIEAWGILDELASLSGGKAYFLREFPRGMTKGLLDIIDQIAMELRHE